MNNLVALTEFLVKQIVKEPDMVSVKQFDDEEEQITIQVLVNESDMGAVIGKGGAERQALALSPAPLPPAGEGNEG